MNQKIEKKIIITIKEKRNKQTERRKKKVKRKNKS